jgi:hypothetical protein
MTVEIIRRDPLGHEDTVTLPLTTKEGRTSYVYGDDAWGAVRGSLEILDTGVGARIVGDIGPWNGEKTPFDRIVNRGDEPVMQQFGLMVYTVSVT